MPDYDAGLPRDLLAPPPITSRHVDVAKMADLQLRTLTDACDESPKRFEPVKKFPLIELFGPVVQGEGVMIGVSTHFIRLGGCSFKCSFCDSLHAVLPELIKQNAEYLTAGEIALRAVELNAHTEWITISGGDPCMWDLTNLIEMLKASGFKIAIETQAVVFQPWLQSCDVVTLSPKGISSGMYSEKTQGQYDAFMHKMMSCMGPEVNLKIVVFTDEDYNFAKEWHEKYPFLPMTLQVGTVTELPDGRKMEQVTLQEVRDQILEDTQKLWQKTLQDPDMSSVRILPQLHSLIFGHRQGV